MTGLTYLMMCFLYFICVSLDIVIFFLQIRLILLWKNISWLVPFDKAGKSLIDAVVAKVSQLLKTKRPLSKKGVCVVALVIFATARIILGAIL